MGDIVSNLMTFGIVGLAAVGVQIITATYMPQFALAGAMGTIITVAVGGAIAKEVKVI